MGRVAAALAVAVALALSFALAGAVIIQSSDSLAAGVRTAFNKGPEVSTRNSELVGGLELVIVDGPPTGGMAGVQLALLGVLLAGIPVAGVGTGLAWRSQRTRATWSSGWRALFLSGFVLQLSNLCLSLLLLLVLSEFEADLSWVLESPALWFAAGLMSNVLCSLVGLWSWRTLLFRTRTGILQLGVQEPPV